MWRKKVRTATEKQQRRIRGMANRRETSVCINVPHTTRWLPLRKELVTQSWVGDKPYLMTVDTVVYVTRLARKSAEPTLHAADGIWGILPYLEGSFPDTLGWRPLKVWVFVASITNNFKVRIPIRPNDFT
jgi:hypothetical protein